MPEIWSDFTGLREESQFQKLDQAETREYGESLEKCAHVFISEDTRVVVCTTAQFAAALEKGLFRSFDKGVVLELPQPPWVCAFMLFFLGDMPQQQANAGDTSQRVIIDEGKVKSVGHKTQVSRNVESIAIIGNQKQIGKAVMSKTEQNPSIDQLRHSPSVRYIENSWPFFMLKEVMRMIAGLE